jgi:hypothetical protein
MQTSFPPDDMTYLLASGIDARFTVFCLKLPTLDIQNFELATNVAESCYEINSAAAPAPEVPVYASVRN